MRRRNPTSLLTGSAFLMTMAFAGACADPPVAAPEHAPEFAKSGGSGEITVSSVDPTGAPQDTTLNVKVGGSNFDRNSTVALGQQGLPSDKITTNSTRYVNPNQLIANVTISADADVGKYDVIVVSGIRKGGIGTELFEVRQTGQIINPTATFTYHDVTPTASGGRLFGDGRNADGATVAGSIGSSYEDGKCNVTSQIFENIAGDATMDPAGKKGAIKNCASKAGRELRLEFGSPLYLAPGAKAAPSITGPHYSNVREVLGLSTVGAVGERRFRLMLRGSSPCNLLRYEARTLRGYSGSPIRVTRIASRAAGDAEDAWLAEPQAVGGRYIAFCENGGTAEDPVLLGVYDVYFRIKVVQK